MIKTNNLTKKFDDITALDSINIDIAEGSIYGLIGSNGSGKSTLLRMISGVYSADGGNLTVDGQNVFDNPRIKSQIAFLGDTPYFLPQSNIKEMADFYRSLYPNFSMEIYDRLSKQFPLDTKKRIASMSKGMQRQAALILALSKPLKIVFLRKFNTALIHKDGTSPISQHFFTSQSNSVTFKLLTILSILSLVSSLLLL